jgi:hypothetical protein
MRDVVEGGLGEREADICITGDSTVAEDVSEYGEGVVRFSRPLGRHDVRPLLAKFWGEPEDPEEEY